MAAKMSSIQIDSGFINDSSFPNESARLHTDGTNATNQLALGEMIMPKMDDMMDMLRISCSTAVIFGGLIPYIPQYVKVKKSRSSEGFSTYVCLTLLLANILRIAFWFGHRFELPLLIQSFVMITGMLAMMDICIRVRNMDPGYVVSSIGVRPNTMRTRRSLFGKVLHSLYNHTAYAADYRDGLNNETAPIYSVTSPRSHPSSDGVASLTNSENQLTVSVESNTSSQSLPYHEQITHSEDSPSEEVGQAHASTSSGLNDDATNNSVSDESPILNNIQDGASTLRELMNDSYSSHITRASNPHDEDSPSSNHEGVPSDKCLNAHYFWDWDDHFSYIKFLLFFSAVLGMITYLLLDSHIYIETLGFVAVFLESLLGVPQLMRNYQKKSTRGMSVEMVILWLSGDIFKTLYFIFRQAPTQFIACGSIQVIIDLLIIVQVLWYRRQVIYSRLPKST